MIKNSQGLYITATSAQRTAQLSCDLRSARAAVSAQPPGLACILSHNLSREDDEINHFANPEKHHDHDARRRRCHCSLPRRTPAWRRSWGETVVSRIQYILRIWPMHRPTIHLSPEASQLRLFQLRRSSDLLSRVFSWSDAHIILRMYRRLLVRQLH